MARSYAGSVAFASALIEKFTETGAPQGQLVKTTNTGTAYSPTQSEQSYSANMVVANHSNETVDGSLIRTTDRKVYMSVDGLTVEPELGDKIILPDATELTLVEPLRAIKPGTTVIAWVMNARA